MAARKDFTSKIISRARIWTDWNDTALVEGYVSEGIGTKITSHKRVIANRHKKKNKILAEGKIMEWTDRNFSRQYKKDINIIFRKFSNLQPVTQEEIKYIEKYIANPEALPYRSLETLVDIALEKWLERI